MEKEKIFVGQITQKAILKYKGFFVLVRELGHDHWILPGGRLNVGETTEDGLKREVQEELGVKCKINKLISVCVYVGSKDKRTQKLFVFYSATVLPKQKIVINNEITHIAYVSKKSELKKYKLHDNQKKIFAEFLG